MTMDINNRKAGDGFIKGDEQTETKPTKRSFDVAFLMLPDEKLLQKQKVGKYEVDLRRVTPSNTDDDEDEEIEVDTPKLDFSKLHGQKYYTTQKQQIFGDPHLGKSKLGSEQKSAFTKVTLASKEARLSPNLSLSPDLSYQNSLSPSPPIRNYQSFPAPFKAQTVPTYQPGFPPEEPPFVLKSPELPGFPKLRPVLSQYPTSYNYHLQPQEMLKIAAQQQPDINIRNPAAAILTSLLPPSLAALSLPAQNVCAKCNISFRMTSDLVYHMRSHHKNDTNDYNKRKREEKLKCPVCAESFRERHHLTRHMTAHQDKDNDADEPKKPKPLFK